MLALCPANVHAQELDMSKLTMTFQEDFDSLSVSPWGPNTRWIAHTPWAGDFGDSRFADPILGVFPFTTKDGILRIEARKNAEGKWESGLLASTDPSARGFSQQYGYFEMRAKLPCGPGVWPAFWLNSILDKSAPASVEIDVIEYYGLAPASYEANLHVWHTNPADDTGPQMRPKQIQVPSNSLCENFNTFGVKVDPEWIIFYLNRNEVFRKETPKEHTRPLGILANLALGPGFPLDKTPNPSFMDIDYIHVYKINP
ncbi:MAG: glycoside hydrolase family 16 protein [Xanthobacteraceae bacterium]|nr:glycoside hydrolase family 16 protein [Xanthobacteraceae bacterium]